MRTEIFGRRSESVEKHGTRGCGYIGKIVSYPGGRYEESGAAYLDLAEPHCALVLGKRGTGKSYTLGVLLEGFSKLEEDVRKNLAIVVVDTMSVFQSLKTKNMEPGECIRMRDFDGLQPEPMDNIQIALPLLTEKRLGEQGKNIFKDLALQISPMDVTTNLWLRLFGLEPRDPHGSLLLESLREAGGKGEWDLADLREIIENKDVKVEEKRGLLALVQMADDTMLFSNDARKMVMPGKITVLDISYLGRLGNLDLRAFVVSYLAEKMLAERTLQTAYDMQVQSGFFAQEMEGCKKPNIENKDNMEKPGLEMDERARSEKKGEGDAPLVWLVIDEAHLFLPSGGECISTQPLIDWIKLGRHPGLSIILATQEPSALHDTAIRQADLVISHQITAEPDIQALGKARQSFMTGDRDLPNMVSQMDSRRGLAIIFDDKTRKMEYCIIRPRMTLHTGMDANALH